MGLEESTLEPVIERNCVRCGAPLTNLEIEASLDAGGPYLCTLHATEELPVTEPEEEVEET